MTGHETRLGKAVTGLVCLLRSRLLIDRYCDRGISLMRDSDHWHYEGRIHYLGFGVNIYRHHYNPERGKRIVIQPWILWDYGVKR